MHAASARVPSRQSKLDPQAWVCLTDKSQNSADCSTAVSTFEWSSYTCRIRNLQPASQISNCNITRSECNLPSIRSHVSTLTAEEAEVSHDSHNQP